MVSQNYNFEGNFDLLNNFKNDEKKYREKLGKKFGRISFSQNIIFNSGHSNIDNLDILFSGGKKTNFTSANISLGGKFFYLRLEPYRKTTNGEFLKNNLISHEDLKDPYFSTFQKNNNYSQSPGESFGLRNSFILLHFNGLGIGYGNMNHWWGPGFHSALTLSTNAPSIKTYSLGTFKDISFGPISFGLKVVSMPYTNSRKNNIFLSGIKSHITYVSNPIVTVGFHRTFLSGDFGSNITGTNQIRRWTIKDATKLVIEPLFGQNKAGISYTQPNTPGFDAWDQLLSGYIKIKFPKDGIEFYADVASDDNRGNFTDLRAHWDHTLGYQLGLKKISNIGKDKFVTGVEYLSTKVSNTFNQKFYRGNPNAVNFYAKTIYDYFTNSGRRMGAHSGSSSDDMIFAIGFINNLRSIFISYNKERHGIKTMEYPEIKSEFIFSYNYNILPNHTLSISIELEGINNFGYILNNYSESKLFWIGYNYYTNFKF